MNDPMIKGPDQKGILQLLVTGIGLGASIGFLLWVIFIYPGELEKVALGIHRYLFLFFPVGLLAAGVVCLMLWFGGGWHIAARMSYVSCVLYFGFLKTLGWDFVPWILIVLAIIVFFRNRNQVAENRHSPLLFHAMGSLAAFYMSFHLDDFLQPWASFSDVVKSLWLLVAG